jgi:hypothetical protein
VLNSINRQCQKVKSCSSSSQNTSQGRDNPGFVAALELLAQLGRVTSCLLCVNGDDRSFSIARVAQVRTHRLTRQCACWHGNLHSIEPAVRQCHSVTRSS